MIDEPRVRLRVGHQHSRFWSIVTRFVVYYSPFWGPVVISIVIEPQGALTCRSSTLAVFGDSDPLHGLLIIVWVSQSDFHGCRIPSSAYVFVFKTRSFG